MTSTLTVIGLVTKIKASSNQVTSGEAIYREKTSQNIAFDFKQFSNARNEYNEALIEGDLVFFGGKFTVDEQKLLVSILHSLLCNNRFINYLYLPFCK
jgi:hypothetical protein